VPRSLLRRLCSARAAAVTKLFVYAYKQTEMSNTPKVDAVVTDEKGTPVATATETMKGGALVLSPLPLNGGRKSRKSRRVARKTVKAVKALGGNVDEVVEGAGRKRKSRKGSRKSRRSYFGY
jgi:hypothetical protein